MTYRVLVRARSTPIIVGSISVYTRLEIVQRYRTGGTWSLTMPAEHPQAAQISTGRGIVVYPPWSASPLMSGSITSIEYDTPEGSPTNLTLTGIDDTALLSHRIVYPDPAELLTAQTTAVQYTDSGTAETVIRALVNKNIGPDARPARRRVVMATANSPAVGTSVSISARFSNLAAEVERLCLAGGVGVRIVQNTSNENVFSVYAGTDRSASMVFSSDRGNLRSWRYTLGAPVGTRVGVAGQGTGTARNIRERSRSEPENDWAMRIEGFVDARDTNTAAVLDQRGDEWLNDNGRTAGLSLSPISTPGYQFGVDYFLGDTVSVRTAGATLSDTLEEVRIVVEGGQERITPIIGSRSLAEDAPGIYPRLRRLVQRLNLIERSL